MATNQDVSQVAPVALKDGELGTIIIQVGPLALSAPFVNRTLQAMANNMLAEGNPINAQSVIIRMLGRVEEFVEGMRGNLDRAKQELSIRAYAESTGDTDEAKAEAAKIRYLELVAEFEAKITLQPMQ